MDWARAIERNSEALKGIVEALFAMLGLAGETTVARIPQPLHRAVLRVLRPAESAMRRLIVIAARGLVVKPAPSRPMPPGTIIGKGGGNPRLSFQLFDPRKNFAGPRRRAFTKNPPRIHFFGTIQGLWPYGRHPRPWLLPFSRPMDSSTPNASAGGYTPSRWHLMICRARQGVSPAGGSDGRPCQAPSSSRRSGPAIRRDTAGSPFTKSMRSSSNATGSPVTQ